jgi:hypothetical protein
MTPNIYLFYSNDHPFSNWYMMPFTHNGIEYNCSEQYMMHMKARMFKDTDVAEMIMQQGHPRKQKFLGREVRGFSKPQWDAKCQDIMVEGLVSKFRQDTYSLTTLLETGDAIIAEASPSDKIWGIGLAEDDPRAKIQGQWQGTNWLGNVLMRTRDVIRG